MRRGDDATVSAAESCLILSWSASRCQRRVSFAWLGMRGIAWANDGESGTWVPHSRDMLLAFYTDSNGRDTIPVCPQPRSRAYFLCALGMPVAASWPKLLPAGRPTT